MHCTSVLSTEDVKDEKDMMLELKSLESGGLTKDRQSKYVPCRCKSRVWPRSRETDKGPLTWWKEWLLVKDDRSAPQG